MAELCHQIASLQYALILEHARAVNHMPTTAKGDKAKRTAALRALRTSASNLDRYAAWIMDGWDAAAAAKARAKRG